MKLSKYVFCPAVLILPEILYAQENINAFEADTLTGSIGSFGGAGLIEMHNARFSPDGELLVGGGLNSSSKDLYATWQATPWLETTLRYSDLKGSDNGVDKGLDVKIRLLDESQYRPSIAIGFQDMLGDGQFSGEYIVTNKVFYDFDITLGVGFGNLASRAKISNIFRIFGDNFNTRSFNNPNSEKIRFGNYFSGQKMGFYGGVEYKTPINGLTAKIEYSTVDKSTLEIFKNYKSKTAFNFGGNYKINDWLEIGASILHGNEFSLQLNFKQNLHKPKRLHFAPGPKIDEIRTRPDNDFIKDENDYQTIEKTDIIFNRLKQMGYNISSLNLSGQSNIYIKIDANELENQDQELLLGAVLTDFDEVTIEFIGNDKKTLFVHKESEEGSAALTKFENSSYFIREKNFNETSPENKAKLTNNIFNKLSEKELNPSIVDIRENEIFIEKTVGPYNDIPQNIGRVARILTNEAPNSVERFTIISKERGLRISEVSVLRQEFEKNADYNSSPEELLATAKIQEPSTILDDEYDLEDFPNFNYGIFPEVISHFGSVKNDHFKGDFNVILFANANVTDDIQIYFEGKKRIIGKLDEIEGSTNAIIPHVRSDIGLYSSEGATSINRLTAEYIKNPFDDFYTRFTAGYLESMYSGFSGEILYRPYGGSLSFGLDLNYVKQRDYDQLFGLQNYKTVTGHATLYHVNSRYDITSKISYGRYLAKDWGTTIDISRQFNNGIRIGAKATFTNISESDFGSGSFDKGIYMTIPFDFFWFKQSREKVRFDFRRLGKDGGQKLDLNTDLFDLFSSGQTYKLRSNWGRILD
jgi:hypothetical protein